MGNINRPMKLYYILGCLTLYINLSSGKKCFQCRDVPHPADCRITTECPDTDSCYVEQLVTGAGSVLYNTGCRSKQRCHGDSKRRIVARADIIACDECCDGDFCNLSGCGQKAPSRVTRGPYCFSCDAQSHEADCRTISKCATDQQCDALQSLVQPVPVGKRNTFRFTTCTTCCKDDFCNNNCSNATAVSVDGHWSEWGQWTSCSVTCDHGTKQRHRSCDYSGSQNHGNPCTGDSMMSVSCSTTHSCLETTTIKAVVHGQWSEWGHWSSCSATCNHGNRYRSRTCHSPSSNSVAVTCVGDSTEADMCRTHLACNMTKDYCKQHHYDWFAVNATLYGCLMMYRHHQNWTKGRTKCHKDKAELYVANTPEKQQLLQQYLTSSLVHGNPSVWIGLTTSLVPLEWRWVGQPSLPISYDHFYNTTELDEHQNDKRCALSIKTKHEYFWLSKNCHSDHYIICEKIH